MEEQIVRPTIHRGIPSAKDELNRYVRSCYEENKRIRDHFLAIGPDQLSKMDLNDRRLLSISKTILGALANDNVGVLRDEHARISSELIASRRIAWTPSATSFPFLWTLKRLGRLLALYLAAREGGTLFDYEPGVDYRIGRDC